MNDLNECFASIKKINKKFSEFIVNNQSNMDNLKKTINTLDEKIKLLNEKQVLFENYKSKELTETKEKINQNLKNTS